MARSLIHSSQIFYLNIEMLADVITRSLSVVFERSRQLGELLEDYRMLSDGTTGNGHEVKHRTFPMNTREHFSTMRVTEQWHRLPRKVVGVSLLRGIAKPSGHGPV